MTIQFQDSFFSKSMRQHFNDAGHRREDVKVFVPRNHGPGVTL